MVTTALKNTLPRPVRRPLGKLYTAYLNWEWKRRGLPTMAKGDLTMFKAVLAAAGGEELRILEWGCGRSTVYYPKFLNSLGRKFSWYGMEFNRPWYDLMMGWIEKANLTSQVHVDFHEFPDPRASWENGISNYGDNTELQKYLYAPKEQGLQFDVIIVDGRLRRRCLLEAQEILAPNGIVMLHDAHRTWYHCGFDTYPHVQFLMIGGAPDNSLAMASLDNLSLMNEIVEKYGPMAAAGRLGEDNLFATATH